MGQVAETVCFHKMNFSSGVLTRNMQLCQVSGIKQSGLQDTLYWLVSKKPETDWGLGISAVEETTDFG